MGAKMDEQALGSIHPASMRFTSFAVREKVGRLPRFHPTHILEVVRKNAVLVNSRFLPPWKHNRLTFILVNSR